MPSVHFLDLYQNSGSISQGTVAQVDDEER